MKDERAKAKSTPQYHFTSDVQEMYDLDQIIREKVNKTIIQLELRELLALSTFLQKSVSNMTKTRCEYNTKPMMVNIVEVLDEEEYSLALAGGYDEELSYSLPEDVYSDAAYVQSCIGLEFDEAMESKEEIMIRYASAVKIHPMPQLLFAMVTG